MTGRYRHAADRRLDHQKAPRKPQPRFQERYPRKPTLARIARFEAMRARLMGKD